MARVALTVGALLCVLAPTASAQSGSVDVKALFDMYLGGQRDEAVARAAAIPDLGPFRLRFVQDSPLWVSADPARIEARSAAVAAFLLEVTAARLESDWGRFSDLIEWTCVQLRTTGPPTEFERTWHAASHALAGRSRNRTWMLGEDARLPHQKPPEQPQTVPRWAQTMNRNEPQPPAHLMHALERFPDDPRFQLSRIVAWTWGRDGEPIRNVRRRDDEDQRRAPARSRAPQLEAIVALEPLTSVPDVAVEAWIRTGLVHFTVGDYASALRAFEAAQPIATDTSLKYLAYFDAGRALEGLQRLDDAIRAYQLALEIVPDAESATVALASLQFMRDDRDAAVSSIDRVFNRKPGPPDPGRLVGYGSFIRWVELKGAMRRALP